MIRRSIRIFALALCAVAAVACDQTPRNSGTLTAIVNGTPFVSSSVQIVRSNGALQLTAIGADSEVVTVQTADASAPGVVYFKPFVVNNYGAVMKGMKSTWSSFGAGGSGTLTFSTATARGASGTFSFTATSTPPDSLAGVKTVTAGAFKVRY